MTVKLIGADDASGTNSSTGYFVLTKFQAVASGNMQEFRVKCNVTGTVKCALYADNAGEPGALITAMDTGQNVTAGGWNTLDFTSSAIVSGTYYWLAVCFDNTGAVQKVASGGIWRYKTATYSTFTFPDPAGNGFTSGTQYELVAGWGDIYIPPRGFYPNILAH